MYAIRSYYGGQLAGKVLVGGNGVAMLAGEIAAPHQIPDHHGAGRVAVGPHGRGVDEFLP